MIKPVNAGSEANFEPVDQDELDNAAAARARREAAALEKAALQKAGVTDTSGFEKSTGGSKALDKAQPTAQKAFDTNEPSVNPTKGPSELFTEGTAAAGAKKFELGSDRTSLTSVMAAQGGQPALSREAVVGTVLAAIPAEQRQSAKALIASGVTDESLAKAFGQVIDARGTPDAKPKALTLNLVALEKVTTTVGLGEGTSEQTTITPASKPTTFDCSLSVSADGKVNGAELPADLATRVAAATTLVASSVKDATLRDAGLSEQWMQAASPEQKGLALAQLLEARQTPGSKTLDLSIESTKTVGWGEEQTTVKSHTAGTLKLEVSADGKVNGKPLTIDATWAAEAKPFPDGNSADKVKTKFELPKTGTDLAALTAANGDQPALAHQAVVETVLAAIPEAQRAQAKALIDNGVSSDSLGKAFAQVIDARGTPGEKALSLGLVALEPKTTTVGWGEDRSVQTTLVPAAKPTTFDCALSVSADGKVNGAELPADLATRVATTFRPVAAEYKDATLREAGLSAEWLQNASEPQKSYALAKIVDAKATPGVKSLDLGFAYTSTTSVGEDTKSVETFAAGTLKLDVSADGKVNGKALTIDAAYNATRAIEAMSTADRKKTLQALGFPAGPIVNASSEQARTALVKAAVSTATPGDKQFEVTMGGDKYAVGMKVGENGQILASATKFIPPPPSSSFFSTLVSAVCTVVSFIQPELAPICQGIQGAISISNGASGLGLLGAAVGVAGGLGDLAGIAGAANLTSLAGTINTVNGAVTSLQQGDMLGFLSNSLTLGAGFATGDLANSLSQAASVARGASGVVNAAKNGDALGLLAAGINTAAAAGIDVGPDLKTVANVAGTAHAIVSGDYAGALLGIVQAMPGATGSTSFTASQGDVRRVDNALDALDATTAAAADASWAEPLGSQADVRRVDNALDAAAALEGAPATSPVDSAPTVAPRTAADVRREFDQAFADARRAGENIFIFDKGDGRGDQRYTTGTREEVAASIAGGSTKDYRQFVKSNFGGTDSPAALRAYRDSKLPPVVAPAPAAVGTDAPAAPPTDGRPAATYANTGSDLLDAGIDRVTNIVTNVRTVAEGTTWGKVGNFLAGAVDGAVSAAVNVKDYIAHANADDILADAGASVSRGFEKFKSDPLGTAVEAARAVGGAAVAVGNAVLPARDIYNGFERLGDAPLTYSEATQALAEGVGGVVGVVTLGVGTGARGAAKAAEVAAAGARDLAEAAARGKVEGAIVDQMAEGAGVYLGEGKFSQVFREGDVVVKQSKPLIELDGQKVALSVAERTDIVRETVEFTNDLNKLMPNIVPPMNARTATSIEMAFEEGVKLKDMGKSGFTAAELLKANDMISETMNKAAKAFDVQPGMYRPIVGGLDVMLDRNTENFLFRKTAEGELEMKWIDPFAVKPTIPNVIEAADAALGTAAGKEARTVVAKVPNLTPNRPIGRTDLSPLSTATSTQQRVADVQGLIDARVAAGSRTDLPLINAFNEARSAGLTTMDMAPGGSAVMANGRTAVELNQSLVDYTRLNDGFEIIGLDEKLPTVANHEVRGHIGDYQKVVQDPTAPYVLRLDDGRGLPGGYAKTGGRFTENTGFVETAAANREVFLDAMARGDTAAARTAVEKLKGTLSTIDGFTNRFFEVGANGLSEDSAEAIRASLKDKMAPGTNTPMTPLTSNFRVVEFSIVDADGSLLKMSTNVPKGLSRAQQADAIEAQMASALNMTADYQQMRASLAADYKAMSEYLNKVAPLPAPAFKSRRIIPG